MVIDDDDFNDNDRDDGEFQAGNDESDDSFLDDEDDERLAGMNVRELITLKLTTLLMDTARDSDDVRSRIGRANGRRSIGPPR